MRRWWAVVVVAVGCSGTDAATDGCGLEQSLDVRRARAADVAAALDAVVAR